MSLVLILGADEAAPYWLRIAEGRIVARGRGTDWPAPEGERVTLIVPAGATSIHRASLPGLAPRQAAAAARMMALENSIGNADTLHVATGPSDAEGGLDIAVVDTRAMAHWLLWAQHQGLDPDAVVPAAMILPRPAEGLVEARIGDETVARDPGSGFLADGLKDLIAAGAAVTRLNDAEVAGALAAAAEEPPLDLRRGLFARRRRGIDWGVLRRSAILIGFILLASLAISLIRIARLEGDSAALDAATVAAARRIEPAAATADAAQAAVNARLAAAGQGGRGFTAPTAQLFSAVKGAPGVTLTRLDQAGGGTLRATLAAARPGDINLALIAIQQAGYAIAADPPQNQGGQTAVSITVEAP